MKAASLLASLALLAASMRASALDYADLVGRLTDLQALATPPPVGETTALASSYDRHSIYDAAHDQYIAWDANSDGNFGAEALTPHDAQGRAIMADIQGPGCIFRMWSAAPGPGHVKIYLDGAATPVVDLPWAAYFDRSSAPFTRPELVYHTGPAPANEQSGGWNNFTPIPFQKSCRIVAEKGWGGYFHFNYTRFAPGTTVPTFVLPLAKADEAALDAANARLAKCGEDPNGAREDEVSMMASTVLQPASQTVLEDVPGPAAITALRITINPDDMPKDLEEQRKLLRTLAIRITFDGDDTPQVWAPLGDFFGTGSGAGVHLNLPSGLKADGTFYSYWYMPYANDAKVVLDNDGTKPIGVRAEIVDAPLAKTKTADTLLRFHAKWHRDAFLPTRPDRAIDWTMLTTKGLGRFVGTQLHIWNPCAGWWGEGDEKFFVDGEKFPSTFGTGSEDYFGYAWGRKELFAQPFHSQTTNEGDSQGNVSVNRWHIADSVPFQKSFEGDIEKYFPNNRPTIYANTVFWYLAAGGDDPYQPAPLAERIGYWEEPYVYHEPQSVEGEAMPVLSRPANAPRSEDMTAPTEAIHQQPGDRNWGGNAQLFWPAGKAGEELDLGFDIATPHAYHFMTHLTYGPSYGIVELSIDHGPWSKPVDLYANVVHPGGSSPPEAHLIAGKHVLSIRVVGKNEGSSGYDVGLDYLKIMPTY